MSSVLHSGHCLPFGASSGASATYLKLGKLGGVRRHRQCQPATPANHQEDCWSVPSYDDARNKLKRHQGRRISLPRHNTLKAIVNGLNCTRRHKHRQVQASISRALQGLNGVHKPIHPASLPHLKQGIFPVAQFHPPPPFLNHRPQSRLCSVSAQIQFSARPAPSQSHSLPTLTNCYYGYPPARSLCRVVRCG